MAKVVVYGAATMDFYFYVDSWLQPSLQIEGSVSSEPGGKGLNQAVACSRLDAETTLVSSIGDDAYGHDILKVLQDEYVRPCIHVEPLPLRREIITDITAVLLNRSDGKKGYIGCRNATDKLTPEYIETEAAAAINEAHAVLVTFDAALEAAIRTIDLAKSARKYTVVNFSPPVDIPLTTIDGVDYVIATAREARSWLRKSGAVAEAELPALSDTQIGEYLLNKGARNVVITRDAEGCIVLNLQGARIYPAYETDMGIDPTGAQSAFCAGVASALAKFAEMQKMPAVSEQELISFASAARTIACTVVGAVDAMPKLATVNMFLAQRAPLRYRADAS